MKSIMPVINNIRAHLWRVYNWGLHPMSPYTARAVLKVNKLEGPDVRY